MEYIDFSENWIIQVHGTLHKSKKLNASQLNGSLLWIAAGFYETLKRKTIAVHPSTISMLKPDWKSLMVQNMTVVVDSDKEQRNSFDRREFLFESPSERLLCLSSSSLDQIHLVDAAEKTIDENNIGNVNVSVFQKFTNLVT